MKSIAGFVVAIAAALVPGDVPGEAGSKTCDVVVYGGASAGVAAVQVKRLGKTVVLIEPTQRLGGLTTGGLGQTDFGSGRIEPNAPPQYQEYVARAWTHHEYLNLATEEAPRLAANYAGALTPPVTPQAFKANRLPWEWGVATLDAGKDRYPGLSERILPADGRVNLNAQDMVEET